MLDIEVLAAARIGNQGASCTTAAVLTGLGALGARDLPALGPGSLALGAPAEGTAPALLDYVTLPGRRAPLDIRIEALALRHGLRVVSRSALVVPGPSPRPRPGEALIANLAWGQERPGHYGTWGFNALRPSSWRTGGHSVVLARVEGPLWRVIDPNHPGVQEWPRAGLAVTVTRIRRAG